MRVLVTRPREDAEALVAALAARGHTALVEPMLQVVFAGDAAAPLDLTGVQAILFTSANGVRAFARMTPRRDLAVLAVGDASAAAARAAGFADVASAGGEVGDLARLAAERLTPSDGALFHGAARSVAGDLKGALEVAGFAVRREVLYETRAARALTPALRTALARGEVDAATFLSPRTAETFVKLLQDEGLGAVCTSLVAVCLSAAVADKIRVLPWRGVRIAAEPNQDALLACIEDVAAGPEPAALEGAMPAQDSSEPDGGAATGDGDAQGARDIIVKFGGIRPMASKLGIAVSTVQGWRERGSIPHARHNQILAAAKAHDIAIDADALAASDRAPEGHAEPAKPAPGAAAPDAPVEATSADGPAQGQGAAARPAGKGTWLGGFAAAAVVFALGFGAALVTQDVWAPRPGPAPIPLPSDDADAERIAALERRLAELDSRPDAAPAEAALRAGLDESRATVAALRDDVAGLRGDLASLDARLASVRAQAGGGSADLAAALSDIEARNAELAAQVAALTNRNAELAGALGALQGDVRGLAKAGLQARTTESAVALAALQMRDALRGGAPFETELQTVKRVAADAPAAQGAALTDAVAALEPHAATGAPGLASLRADFPAVARRVVAQSRGGAGDGMLADVLRRVAGLVTVRPVGPVEGDSAAAVVARAEELLKDGDLGAAVAELAALSGPAAEAAAPWRARAEARLAADAALVRLGQILAAGHAGANG